MIYTAEGRIVDRSPEGDVIEVTPEAVVARIRQAVGDNTLLELRGLDNRPEVGRWAGERALKGTIHTYVALTGIPKGQTEQVEYGARAGATAPDGAQIWVAADSREVAATYSIQSVNPLFETNEEPGEQ